MAGSGYSFVPVRTVFDRYLDPVTNDFVKRPDGSYVETPDSRTTMLISLSVHLGSSPVDYNDGTDIERRRLSGEPIDPLFIESEVRRVGQILERDGILSDLDVRATDEKGEPIYDPNGRLLVHVRWRDLGTNAPTYLPYNPR